MLKRAMIIYLGYKGELKELNSANLRILVEDSMTISPFPQARFCFTLISNPE